MELISLLLKTLRAKQPFQRTIWIEVFNDSKVSIVGFQQAGDQICIISRKSASVYLGLCSFHCLLQAFR